MPCADDTGLHLPWGTVTWKSDSALEFMDRLGIEKSVISISTPGIPYGDLSEVKDMARKVSLLVLLAGGQSLNLGPQLDTVLSLPKATCVQP